MDRLTGEEFEALLRAAYERDGVYGLMIRALLETGSRVGAFCRMTVEDIIAVAQAATPKLEVIIRKAIENVDASQLG